MKYRHIYHAGNFADLHKHLTWMALLQAMQRKDKGFLILDTHAGCGFYDLSSAESRQSDEAARGIKSLTSSVSAPHEQPLQLTQCLSQFLGELQRLRTAAGLRSGYPGSPAWTLAQLRPQDRLVVFEAQPAEHRRLEKSLAQLSTTLEPHIKRNVKCVCDDGFAGLAGWLPPSERRALILIDPPYENSDEDFSAVKAALSTILTRLAQAVVAVWYPIKHRADADRKLANWLQGLPRSATAPQGPSTLRSELWLHPCDSRAGLNGSGLLVVNPPWQLDETLRGFMPTLVTALDTTHSGGWQIS